MLIVDQSHSFTHTLLNNIEWIEETEDLLQPSFFDVHLTLPLELIEILDSSISNDNNVNRISWMLTLWFQYEIERQMEKRVANSINIDTIQEQGIEHHHLWRAVSSWWWIIVYSIILYSFLYRLAVKCAFSPFEPSSFDLSILDLLKVYWVSFIIID